MWLKFFIKRRGSACLLVALAACIGLNACSKNNGESVLRVGTNLWPGYESLYLAKEMNLFGQSNIDLIELPSATDVMQAIRLKSIEVGALTLDEAITLASEGLDIKIFLVMDISNGADALVLNKSLSSLSDIKGKRIGYEDSALGALMLQEALNAADLDITDITPVQIRVDGHVKAYQQGQVDGVISFEPVVTQLILLGGYVAFDSRHIPEKIVDVLVIRTEDIDEYRQVLTQLITGNFKAIETIKSRPLETASMLAPRLGLTSDELIKAFEGIKLADLVVNEQLLTTDLFYSLEELNQLMLEDDLISKPINARALVDSSLLSEAQGGR